MVGMVGRRSGSQGILASVALAAVGCGVSQIYTTPQVVAPPDAGGCRLTISPLALDFGSVTLRSAAFGWVDFIDTGDALCELSQFSLGAGSDPSFSIGPSPPMSVALLAGTAGGIEVELTTPAVAPAAHLTGSLTFLTNDPRQPSITIPLSADVTP
jgi:hypothetical protein